MHFSTTSLSSGRAKIAAALATLAVGVTLAGCAGSPAPQSSEVESESQSSDAKAAAGVGWPRSVEHEMGVTEIESQPVRIVSTSPSVTGTLLAMDAPVVATTAASPSPITDDKGFFSQWASVADDRGVEILYPNLEFDLESIIAASPDLVIISTSGADSVADHYDEIAKLYPTIAVDYSNQTWQELAQQLGGAIGFETEAGQAIDDFDSYAQQAASKLDVPFSSANIVSFNGSSEDSRIALTTGPHAALFKALGIEVIDPPADAVGKESRGDFASVTLENLPKAVNGDAVFLLTGTDQTVEQFNSEPVLANLPAVQQSQVYPMGPSSFRIDYYSGKEIIDLLVETLS